MENMDSIILISIVEIIWVRIVLLLSSYFKNSGIRCVAFTAYVSSLEGHGRPLLKTHSCSPTQQRSQGLLEKESLKQCRASAREIVFPVEHAS